MPLGLSELIGPVANLLEGIIPDVNERREQANKISLAMLDVVQKSEQGQLDANIVQAGSDSLFVAGARPFTMWGAAICFFYTVGGVPFLQNMMEIFIPIVDSVMGADSPTAIPTLTKLSTEEIKPVLYGLLGLGGYRSFEKYNGVSRESLRSGRGMFSRWRRKD